MNQRARRPAYEITKCCATLRYGVSKYLLYRLRETLETGLGDTPGGAIRSDTGDEQGFRSVNIATPTTLLASMMNGLTAIRRPRERRYRCAPLNASSSGSGPSAANGPGSVPAANH